MTTRYCWIRAISTIALLAATNAGCMLDGSADMKESADPDITKTSDDLAAYAFGTWTPWTMPVNVCFRRLSVNDPEAKDSNGVVQPSWVPNDAQFASLKLWALTALADTWQLVPGISFVDNLTTDTCGPTTPSTFLHFQPVLWGSGFGGRCGQGVGTSCNIGGGTPQVDYFKYVVVHEVGHALGFGHEHSRAGVTNCATLQVAGCQRCKDSIDAGQACAAADWNVCTNQAVTTPQMFAAGSPQYQVLVANLGNGDILPVPTFALLTNYDPQSIMNYCGVPSRVPDDYHLTSLDLLGAEMTYPVNRTYPIGCQTGCFVSQAGVITRTDGVLTTNWTMRGGTNVIMRSPVNGQNVTSVPASSLPAGTSPLTFTFFAPRNQFLLTTSGTLVNSTDVHTALVGASQLAVMM